MKTLMLAVAVVFSTAAAQAADSRGQVSSDTLSQFGLGGIQTLSDDQGMQIRGQGWISLHGTFQVNVLIVRTPSANVQQNSIKGGNKIKVSLGGFGRGPVGPPAP